MSHREWDPFHDLMLGFVLIVISDYALLTCMYLYNAGGSVWPPSQIFRLPNLISLHLLIRRGEVVELPSHLIVLLPSRPPKVDRLSSLQAY